MGVVLLCNVTLPTADAEGPSNVKRCDNPRIMHDASRESVAEGMPWRSTQTQPRGACVTGPDQAHFWRPVRGDTPLGQAQQQALRNARQSAQRVAEHIAMVANVDDANHERGMCSRVLQHSPAVPSMQQGCLLNAARSDCSSRCCKGNACIRHACMQRIAPPRCQRVQHR